MNRNINFEKYTRETTTTKHVYLLLLLLLLCDCVEIEFRLLNIYYYLISFFNYCHLSE